jgi:hypothetical protein
MHASRPAHHQPAALGLLLGLHRWLAVRQRIKLLHFFENRPAPRHVAVLKTLKARVFESLQRLLTFVSVEDLQHRTILGTDIAVIQSV